MPASEVKSPASVHVRWMVRHDMPEVLAIESASFAFPWSEQDFLKNLRDRNTIGMVAEYGERVVGFMIYELHKHKLQVLDFAVDPGFRRRGVGRQMVAKLVGKLSPHRRTSIELTERETNLPGQLFWRSAGFQAHTVCREHYPDTGEDAYEFAYVLVDEAPIYAVSTSRLRYFAP